MGRRRSGRRPVVGMESSVGGRETDVKSGGR